MRDDDTDDDADDDVGDVVLVQTSEEEYKKDHMIAGKGIHSGPGGIKVSGDKNPFCDIYCARGCKT